MSSVSINVDLGGLAAIGDVLSKETARRVRAAVGAVASQGQINWAHAVMQASGIWSQEKTDYARSIKWEYTGDFSARVSSDFRYASEIENGRPARDLKLMLNTSLKARVAQNGKNAGKRYLIIPMRHNTTGNEAHAPAMPQEVYQQALQLAPSRVTGMGRRESGTGAWDTKTRAPAMVPQRKYAWGGRLEGDQFNNLTSQQKRRYDGMVRFDTAGKGKSASSSFLTFRVMMEGSPGWVVAAKPGQMLMTGVVSRLQPVAEQVIAKAVQLDMS